MKKEIKIRIRKELYERYQTFSSHTGISIPSAMVYQLGEFYVKNSDNPELDEIMKEKLTRESRGNFSVPVTLSIAEPLYKFIEDIASQYEIPIYVLIRNIVEIYRAEVKIPGLLG